MKAMSLVQRTTFFATASPASSLYKDTLVAFTPQRSFNFNYAITRRAGVRNICRARNLSSSITTEADEHATFLNEVAAVEPIESLKALLDVLQAKGERLVSPYKKRNGILPLTIPLSENQDGEVTALLRWPTPSSKMGVPVVRVRSYGVTLLARTPEEYIHRALVEEDTDTKSSSGGQVAESAGTLGRSLYVKGDFGASKLSSVDVYLMKQVGMFPDVFERLALRHLEKGDSISALVTGEYYSNKSHFPGFGRPFVFNAELMVKVGRQLEAKDAARVALATPWWTLGSSFSEVASIAGWGDEQVEYKRFRVTEEGRQEDLLKGKTPEQVAVDQAAFLLDVAAVDGSWDEVREQLASLYKEGGLEDVSKLVATV